MVPNVTSTNESVTDPAASAQVLRRCPICKITAGRHRCDCPERGLRMRTIGLTPRPLHRLPAEVRGRAVIDINRCPRCGGTSRHVKAGISRNGKKYGEFWVCTNRPPCTETWQGRTRDLSWRHEPQWTAINRKAGRPAAGIVVLSKPDDNRCGCGRRALPGLKRCSFHQDRAEKSGRAPVLLEERVVTQRLDHRNEIRAYGSPGSPVRPKIAYFCRDCGAAHFGLPGGLCPRCAGPREATVDHLRVPRPPS